MLLCVQRIWWLSIFFFMACSVFYVLVPCLNLCFGVSRHASVFSKYGRIGLCSMFGLCQPPCNTPTNANTQDSYALVSTPTQWVTLDILTEHLRSYWSNCHTQSQQWKNYEKKVETKEGHNWNCCDVKVQVIVASHSQELLGDLKP